MKGIVLQPSPMEVAFPNELLIALREEPEGFRQKVLIYTLGKLYEMGRISGGFAAQILHHAPCHRLPKKSDYYEVTPLF